MLRIHPFILKSAWIRWINPPCKFQTSAKPIVLVARVHAVVLLQVGRLRELAPTNLASERGLLIEAERETEQFRFSSQLLYRRRWKKEGSTGSVNSPVGLDSQVYPRVLGEVAGVGEGLVALRAFVGLRLPHVDLRVHLQVRLRIEDLQWEGDRTPF